jgi:DNA polymerase-3 subunit chi
MLVDFYHLAAAPVERVLPSIAEKVLAGGGRLLVVAEQGLLADLDRALWTAAAESFVPHGLDNAENQPVLLTPDPAPVNGAANIALADGRWRDAALAFERVFYFFDSFTLDEARDQWRALKGKEGVETRYWKRTEAGGWVQGP